MIVECSNCGTKYDEYWMIKLHTGRNTQFLCWECYQQGQREAHLNEIRRNTSIAKSQDSKKVKNK